MNTDKQKHFLNHISRTKRSGDYPNRVDRGDRYRKGFNSLDWFHLQQLKRLANVLEKHLHQNSYTCKCQKLAIVLCSLLAFGKMYSKEFFKKAQKNSLYGPPRLSVVKSILIPLFPPTSQVWSQKSAWDAVSPIKYLLN